MRRYGPLLKGDWGVGETCPACKVVVEIGDSITLVPVGPGPDREEREKARLGRPYNSVAIIVHYACATGEES